MLKQFSKVLVMFFVISVITGCVQYEPESNATATEESIEPTEVENYPPQDSNERGSFVNQLVFPSLEEFLDAYATAKEGGESSNHRVAILAESLDFASLKTIYLLPNIPEEYPLRAIEVYNDSIGFWYVPEKDENNHEEQYASPFDVKYFQFIVTFPTERDLKESGVANFPLDGIMRQNGFTEDDFIDGKYLYNEALKTIHWAEGNNRLGLQLPGAYEIYEGAAFNPADIGLDEDYSVYDLINFAQTVTIDLQDTNNIAAWSAGDFTMVEDLLR